MPDLLHCPRCDATNPAEAQWCSQCYTAFPSHRADSAPPTEQADIQHLDLATEPVSDDVARRWRCGSCGDENSVDDSACESCGTSIYVTFGAGSDVSVPLPPKAALAASVIPGFGLVRAGRPLEGILAGVVVISFAVFGVFMLSRPLLAGLLFAAAIAMWFIATRDAFMVGGGAVHEVWLTPSSIRYVVGISLGLIGLVLLVVVSSGGPS